jgi:hypothetical protein
LGGFIAEGRKVGAIGLKDAAAGLNAEFGVPCMVNVVAAL